MANRKLIASAIGDSRLGVFDEIIGNQFDDLDLATMMCYLIDVVHPSAFPFLANQLDVEGFRGYDQCTTDDQRRELLKQAINLHRKIGTIEAIRKACSIIGFTPQEIEEGVELIDGFPVWCAFSIRIDPNDLSTFTPNTLSTLRTFINYYKNARSILKEIYFGITVNEDKIFTTQESLRDNLTIVGTLATDGDYNNDYSYDYY